MVPTTSMVCGARVCEKPEGLAPVGVSTTVSWKVPVLRVMAGAVSAWPKASAVNPPSPALLKAPSPFATNWPLSVSAAGPWAALSASRSAVSAVPYCCVAPRSSVNTPVMPVGASVPAPPVWASSAVA